MDAKKTAITITAAIMVAVALFFIVLQLSPDLGTPAGTIAGKVSNASGTGLAGVSIFYQPMTGGVPPSPPYGNEPTTTTAEDGSYSFSNVPVGEYQLTFGKLTNPDGTYYEPTTKTATVTAGSTTTVDVTMVN